MHHHAIDRRPKWLGGLLLGLILLVAGAAHAQRPYFNGMQKRMLSDGKVLVSPETPTDNSGVAAMAVGVVDFPIDKVWPAIRDCEHYSKFMPRTKKSDRRDEGKVCFTEISMPFPLGNLWAESYSELSELPGGGKKRAWKLKKGNYKRNNGSWELWPLEGDDQRTLVIYRLDVDPDMVVPDAILRKAQTGTLPDVFKALTKRVKQLN